MLPSSLSRILYIPPRYLILLLLFAVTSLIGQETANTLALTSANPGTSTTNDPHFPRNSLTLFGTGTFANSDFYAQASPSHLFLFGVSFRRRVAGNNVLEFSYTPDIIPFAALIQPRLSGTIITSNTQTETQLRNGYGAGANPIGFEVSLLPHRRLQPFLRSSGGFLYFNTAVPSPAAAQFNFTAAAAFGVRAVLEKGRALDFAYVFHHLSNAFQAQDNPGVDSQMFYFGFTFSLGRSH